MKLSRRGKEAAAKLAERQQSKPPALSRYAARHRPQLEEKEPVQH